MSKRDQKKELRPCDDIGSSLSAIIRFSMNEEFRNKCFEVMDVDCRAAFEQKIKIKLQEFCTREGFNAEPNLTNISFKNNSSKTKKSYELNDQNIGATEVTSQKENEQDRGEPATPTVRKTNWLQVAVQQAKNLPSRRATTYPAYPGLEGDEITSSILYRSQPNDNTPKKRRVENFETIGHSTYACLSELVRSPSVRNLQVYSPAIFNWQQSPYAITESAYSQERIRREETRKVLFFDENESD